MSFSYILTIHLVGIVIVSVLEFMYIYFRAKDRLFSGEVDLFQVAKDNSNESLREIIREVLDDNRRERKIFKLAILLILLRFMYCVFIMRY